MTGTEPAAPPAPAPPEKNRGSRREGRYRLSQLFFNFYLVAMGSFVVIAFLADFIISSAQRGITDDYARRFMRGTVLLIEEDLLRHPRHNWQREIKALNGKFAYRLELVERQSLTHLPPAQMEKLDQGDIAIVQNGEVLYHLIKGSKQVLMVGPLTQDKPEVTPGGMPLELRLQLLTWSLIGVIFAIALWFWLRPIWRDLETLRQTARALGDGDFSARSPTTRSKLFAPLSLTLNGMAERIQQLIANHRELTSTISHELRTPIARLRFALEMLSESTEASERERLWIMMEQDLVELDQLIDTSLTYARLERNTPLRDFYRVAFAEWLEDEVESLRPLAGNLSIETELANLPEECLVDVNRKLMPYAFKNLLRNAFKYAQSKIIVSAEITADRACVHVDDDGIGIPAEHRERVFQAFTRLDRARDRATAGHGLGLAIARRVLDMHGGTATTEPSPLGGARFTLSWPRYQDLPAAG